LNKGNYILAAPASSAESVVANKLTYTLQREDKPLGTSVRLKRQVTYWNQPCAIKENCPKGGWECRKKRCDPPKANGRYICGTRVASECAVGQSCIFVNPPRGSENMGQCYGNSEKKPESWHSMGPLRFVGL
jgi:hypothetical protein